MSGSPSDETVGRDGVPAKKKRRVPIACDLCRARKTKCDARKPVCSTCEISETTCEYTNTGINSGSKIVIDKRYFTSLESRLQKMEQQQQTVVMTPSSSSQHIPNEQQSVDGSTVMFSISNERGKHGSKIPLPLENGNWLPNITLPLSSHGPEFSVRPLPKETKPQGTIVADPDVFIGGDSGVYFTQLIINALNQPNEPFETIHTQPLSTPREEQQQPSLDLTMDLYELPDNTNELLDIFFDFHFVLSPPFHQPTIRRRFAAAIACSVHLRYVEHTLTLALINMCLAISICHRRPSMESARSKGRRVYERAMALVQPTLLRGGCIEKVQLLLLGARYLQSSSYPDESWNLLGLAIRIAYGLELHKNPRENLNFIMREEHKRTWYACFQFDKLFSMAYGRPSATASALFSVEFPEDLEDECIQADRLLFPQPKRPSFMSFSIQVSKLYKVMERALSQTHDESTSDLDTIVSLDAEYESWVDNLPPQLRVYDGQKPEKEEAVILNLRANMVRILIHRQSMTPPLSMLIGISGESSGLDITPRSKFKSHIAQYSRSICVKAAMDTISLVQMRHDITADSVGPSWFNLYYCMSR